MKCTKCGFEFEEGIFCPECGTKNVEIEEKAISSKTLNDEKPIFLSIVVIAIVFWFSAGIGSLIMTVVRMVKYPQRKRSNIALLIFHAIWVLLIVWIMS